LMECPRVRRPTRPSSRPLRARDSGDFGM
jgi:hypothetical protein